MARFWGIPSLWHDLPDPHRDALLGDMSQLTKAARRKFVDLGVLDDDGTLTERGETAVQFGKNVRELERLKLKVYSWQGHRHECPTAANGGKQTDEVMAAKSKAAVARAAGVNRPAQLFNLGDTGNEEQIAGAMQEPGVVFWRPIDGRGAFTKGKEQP